MKKLLILLAIFTIAFCLYSCSGGDTYNPAVIAELTQKTKDKEEFTDSDRDKVASQMLGIAKEIEATYKKAGGDKAKFRELTDNDEYKEMIHSYLGLAIYYEFHKAEFSEKATKKIDEAAEILKQYN